MKLLETLVGSGIAVPAAQVIAITILTRKVIRRELDYLHDRLAVIESRLGIFRIGSRRARRRARAATDDEPTVKVRHAQLAEK